MQSSFFTQLQKPVPKPSTPPQMPASEFKTVLSKLSEKASQQLPVFEQFSSCYSSRYRRLFLSVKTLFSPTLFILFYHVP
jgi:hypothetical protein